MDTLIVITFSQFSQSAKHHNQPLIPIQFKPFSLEKCLFSSVRPPSWGLYRRTKATQREIACCK